MRTIRIVNTCEQETSQIRAKKCYTFAMSKKPINLSQRGRLGGKARADDDRRGTRCVRQTSRRGAVETNTQVGTVRASPQGRTRAVGQSQTALEGSVIMDQQQTLDWLIPRL